MKLLFVVLILLLPIGYSMATGVKTRRTQKAKPEGKVLAAVNAVWEVKEFMRDQPKTFV